MFRISMEELFAPYRRNLQTHYDDSSIPLGIYVHYKELMSHIYSRSSGIPIETGDLNKSVDALVAEYGRNSYEVLSTIVRNASGLYKKEEIIYVCNQILSKLGVFLPDLVRLKHTHPIFSAERVMVELYDKNVNLIGKVLTTLDSFLYDLRRVIMNYANYYGINDDLKEKLDYLTITYKLIDKKGNIISDNQLYESKTATTEPAITKPAITDSVIDFVNLNQRMDGIFDRLNYIETKISEYEDIDQKK